MDKLKQQVYDELERRGAITDAQNPVVNELARRGVIRPLPMRVSDDILRAWGTDKKRGITPEVHYWRVRDNKKATPAERLWADEWKRRFGEPERPLPGPRITRSDTAVDRQLRESAAKFMSIMGSAGHPGSRGVPTTQTVSGVGELAQALSAVKPVVYGAISGMRPSEAPPTWIEALTQRVMPNAALLSQRPPNESTLQGILRGAASTLATFPEPENIGIMKAAGMIAGPLASAIARGAGPARAIPQAMRPVAATATHLAPMGYFTAEAGRGAVEQSKQGDTAGALGTMLGMLAPLILGGGAYALARKRAAAQAKPAPSPEPAKPAGPEPQPAGPVKPAPETPPDVLTGATTVAPPEAKPAQAPAPQTTQPLQPTHKIGETPVVKVGGRWREVTADGKTGRERRPTPSKPLVPIETAKAGGPPVAEPVKQTEPTAVAQPSAKQEPQVVPNEPVKTEPVGGPPRAEKPATAPAPEVEPWQMTRAEYAEHVKSQAHAGKALLPLSEHRVAVSKALREGKPVPEKVLADYPDLAKGAADTAQAETRGGPEVAEPAAIPSKLVADVYGMTQAQRTEKAVRAKYGDAAVDAAIQAGDLVITGAGPTKRLVTVTAKGRESLLCGIDSPKLIKRQGRGGEHVILYVDITGETFRPPFGTVRRTVRSGHRMLAQVDLLLSDVRKAVTSSYDLFYDAKASLAVPKPARAASVQAETTPVAKGASNAVTEQGATPVGSVKGGPEGAGQAQAEGVARSGQGPETAGAKEAGQGPVAQSPVSPVTGKMGSNERPWKAGKNSGYVEFESDLQRDLFDLGAAYRRQVRPTGREWNEATKAQREATTRQRAERLAPVLGVTPEEAIVIARRVYDDVCAQMKGLKDGYTRKVTDNVTKKGGETRGEVQQAETGERGAVPATQAEAPAQGRERSGSVGSRDRTQEVRQGEVPATGGERAQGPVTEPEPVKAQQGQQGGAKAPAEQPTQTSYVPPKLPTYEEATAKPPPMDSAGHASWRDDIILAAKREGVPFTQVADFFERLKLSRESVYEGIKRDYPEIAEKWRKETFGAKREAEYQKMEKDLAREDAAEERRAAREAAAEEREEMLEGLKIDLSNERENLARLNKDLKTAETPAERKEITDAIEASEAEIARLTQEIADVKKGKGGSRSQQALKDAQDMVGMEITPDRQPEPPITTTDVETAFPGSRVTQEGNTWTVETPNGRRFNVRVEESVLGQGGELAGALVVFEADGARQSVPADGFILLSQSAGAGKGVLNHEAFHAAWRFALTDEQRAVLVRAFGSEEQAALHYGRTWDSIGARPRGVFETIKRWASRIVERIVKPTQARSRRILENVKSGEVWGGGPPSLRRPNAEGIGPFDLWLGNPLSVGPRKGGPRIPGTLERFAGETGARASDIAVTLNHQAVTQLADWFNEARAVMETASRGIRGRRARLEARHRLAEAVELPRDDPRRAQIDAELAGAVTDYANLMENARQYIIRTLRELGRGVPDDWGVDSYMPHLFSGDIQLYDVKTGRALGWFENILQAERAWNDLTDAQKATTGLRFFERRMPGMQYVRASARNIAARHIAEATTLTPEQVMSLMARGRITSLTGKMKFAGFLQKRRGTEGYRTDIDRVTEDYLAQVVRWAELSKLQRRWQPIIDSVGQHNPTVAMYMQEYLDYRWAKPTLSEMAFGNAVARTPVLNKLAKGNPDFYTRRMVRFLTAMTHQTTINWNVISAATNGTQPLQTMYPFLRGGMKELVSYYNRLPRNFARLKRAGVFRTGTKLETVFDPFSREIIKSPYGACSDLNRGVGYLWGEDLAKRWNNAHPDDPIDLHEAGLDMARWVEFDNTINAPKAFWNVIGRLLTQYKGFPVNMVNVLRYLATRHAGETLRQPIERMTRFGAMTVAHGGVKAALPFLGAKMLWDGAMRVASEITDDKKQQEAIAKVAVFGLPALIGFDQSMRVAFLDMMPESSVEGTVGKFVLGPTLGKAVRLYSGTKRAITAKGEDRQRVVSQTASAVVQPVRSALAAHRLLSGKGNKYPMGKQDIEVSPWANVVSILGGTPIETSVARAKGGAKEESYTVGGKSSKGGKPSNLIMPGRRSGSRKW